MWKVVRNYLNKQAICSSTTERNLVLLTTNKNMNIRFDPFLRRSRSGRSCADAFQFPMFQLRYVTEWGFVCHFGSIHPPPPQPNQRLGLDPLLLARHSARLLQ